MTVSDTTPDRKKNSFLLFVAYLQIIGIILVVFGHSFHEYPDGQNGTSLTVYRMMHSFRMPLFMFTSGFLMAYTTASTQKSWGSFTKGKIRRLLLPFTFLTLLTFVPRALLSDIADDSIHLTSGEFIRAFFDSDCLPIPFFWFIQSSFTLLVVIYAVIRLGRKHNIKPYVYYTVVLIVFVAANTSDIVFTKFFSLNMTVSLSVFFVAGCIYFEYMTRIDRIIHWEKTWATVIFALLWSASFCLGDSYGMNMYYICGLTGIGMIISVAKTLERKKIRVLDHLIGSNYMIFLLSWYFNVITQQVLSHIITLPWWIHTALSLVCGIYFPWIIYIYMQHNSHARPVKAAAFILGQSLKPRKTSVAATYVDDSLDKVKTSY